MSALNASPDFAKAVGRKKNVYLPAITSLVGAGLLLLSACDRGAATKTSGAAELSDTTKTVLNQLSLPVEIRFYSVLDSNTLPESTFAFAQRVQELLTRYEQAGGGKLKIVREESDAGAAAREGLAGFNREKGDVCYLGMVVANEHRKEALPRLEPAWEEALEADLSRAIARVGAPLPSAAPAVVADPALQEEVKRQLPDLANLSVKEGEQRLRQAALEEFRKAMTEMEAALKAAQERMQSTEGPAREQARQELLKLQAEQTERMKEIAARSQAQVEALRQMKAK